MVKHLLMVQWVIGSIHHGPIELFLIPARYNKDYGLYYRVCGMVYLKRSLLL